MPKNTLFNFITFLKQNNPTTDQEFVLKKNSNSTDYYLIPLTMTEKINVACGQGLLLLTEHHISVYANESKDNPNLSQYHYTAYLDDEKGVKYCLHVYFDGHNQLTRNPTLEKYLPDTGSEPIDITAQEKQFTALAMQWTYPIINGLKKQQYDRTSALREKYDSHMAVLEKALFSDQMKSKETQYLVDAAFELSTQLLLLVKSKALSKEHRFLDVMKKALKEPIKPSLQTMKSEVPDVEVDEMTDSPGDPEMFLPRVSHNASRKGEQAPSVSHLNAFATIQDHWRALNDNDAIPQQIKKVEALLQLIAEFNLIHGDQVDWTCLKALEELRVKVFSKGDVLFKRLVIGEQFDLAKDMPSFYHRLTPAYLALALQLEKEALLDFVVSHADMDVSHQAITVGKQTFSSAMHACIALSSHKNMSACFSRLIKEGHSLLEVDEQGKPVILPVLIDNAHPLKQSLLANRDKTLDSLPFLKSMVSLLENYLKNGKVESTEKMLILGVIEKLTKDIQLWQNMKLTPSLKKLRTNISAFEQLDKNEVLLKLKKDSTIISLLAQLDMASQLLLQRLKPNQLTASVHQASRWEEGFKQLVNQVDFSQLNYESFRKEVISLLKNTLSIIQKKDEALLLTEQLKRTRIPTKAARRDSARCQKLSQEIRELSKSNPFAKSLPVFEEQSPLNRIMEIQKSLNECTSLMSKMMEFINSDAFNPRTFENANDTKETQSEADEFADLVFSVDEEDESEKASHVPGLN
ncbi:hypothetical protein [Legionella taurinensis]|uniref:Coiled-coil-containing protein n=1 Tax=Legionella taurinensis TaxID=70611 RepID=A0A3A5LHH9_9GAMM|nr:hypothetical protein [Legionella taurinensis]RJT49345.1 hypothetical protein D6J04_01460 [Legionella taurinensis]RJT69378.1 hypothetical protein D6J03_01720 [Legionella taurinensis]STY26757.1 coiled-coil-containing protein [Legionella taurinensis]